MLIIEEIQVLKSEYFQWIDGVPVIGLWNLFYDEVDMPMDHDLWFLWRGEVLDIMDSFLGWFWLSIVIILLFQFTSLQIFSVVEVTPLHLINS
jgi:hypothetical protein